MQLTYFVTASTEKQELTNLLTQLSKEADFYKDQLIIQLDSQSVTLEVVDLVSEFVYTYDYIDPTHNIIVIKTPLNNDFATFKNNAFTVATGEFIFQIDADETLSEGFVKNLRNVILSNPDVDLYLVNRKNRVSGLTDEWIKKWNWDVSMVDGELLVNYADPQTRIYRNDSFISWSGRVHERIRGARCYAVYPAPFHLNHNKTLARQIAQNNRYESM